MAAGQTLTIGPLDNRSGGVSGGVRGYLAVQGGIQVPLYLNSRATFPSGIFGGHQVSVVDIDGGECGGY